MFCKMQIESLLCCLPGRIFMLGYAYMKMVLNPLIIFWLIYNMQRMTQFRMAACGFIAALMFIDIIFQTILVVKVHRNTANNFFMYNKYTKLMWMMALILGITYFICELCEINVTRYFYEIDDIVIIVILVAIICALIQTMIWNSLAMSNNEADKSNRAFKMDFSLEIGPPSPQQPAVAKVEEYENTVEEIVTTNEKAKLTE